MSDRDKQFVAAAQLYRQASNDEDRLEEQARRMRDEYEAARGRRAAAQKALEEFVGANLRVRAVNLGDAVVLVEHHASPPINSTTVRLISTVNVARLT